ncbi:MAG: cupin domain-containing protein, partial [Pyrinomonadaceae bacterium]
MIAIVLCAFAGVTWQLVEALQTGIKRTDLQRRDLSTPGREVIQVRVDLAPGAAFPKHSHPGEEVIYVIDGTFEYEIDGK